MFGMETFLTLLLVFICVKNIAADCLDHWIQHSGQCYLFVDHTKLDWNDAMNFCKNFDSELAEVQTSVEEHFLAQHLRQHGTGDTNSEGFWLGGSDIIWEGEWMWMTSKTLLSKAYTAWRPGEPNNHKNNEHCLEIQHTTFLWNDAPCDHQRHFICERESHLVGELVG